MYTCASIGASIETFALEIRHLQRTELREAEEGFREGEQKGSSAMPHKRNPIKTEQLCGLARVLRANVQAGLEDVALWHERDISHSSVERVIGPDATVTLDFALNRLDVLVGHSSTTSYSASSTSRRGEGMYGRSARSCTAGPSRTVRSRS